jgi:hypothetical protein
VIVTPEIYYESNLFSCYCARRHGLADL